MIILLALLAIILSLVITKTSFIKRNPSNIKFMKQLGMAILVGIMTINILYTSNGITAFKYTIVGMGLMSFISILVEMLISKKKRTHHECS